MALDPMISALQGSQSSQSPMMSGLFGVPPEHLQQMAGDLLMFPTARTVLPQAMGHTVGQPIIGQTPAGATRVLGPDPYAAFKAEQQRGPGQETNVTTMPGVWPGAGFGSSWFGKLHPSPATMMQYLREQGMVPY